MKPRPMISTLVARGRSLGVFVSPQCSWGGIHIYMRGLQASRRTTLTSLYTASLRSYATPATRQRQSNTATVPAKVHPSKKAAAATTTTTTTVPAKVPPSKATTIPILKAKQLLNPPPYTYAPDISVPARQSGQNFFKYIYSVGRVYLTFYKSGLSNVRQTLKLAKTLRAKATQYQAARGGSSSSVETIASTAVLSRAEWQIVRRSGADKLRLPAFGILVLLLGEWLPLVVMYLTPVIPEACRIPQQVRRNLRQIEQRRAERLASLPFSSRQSLQARSSPGGLWKMPPPSSCFPSSLNSASLVEGMSYPELMRLSAQYDCHARVWDWSLRFAGIAPSEWMLRRSVGTTLLYLNLDDALIGRDGGWAALGEEEVQRACVERGIAVVGKKESEMRRALAGWKGTGVGVGG